MFVNFIRGVGCSRESIPLLWNIPSSNISPFRSIQPLIGMCIMTRFILQEIGVYPNTGLLGGVCVYIYTYIRPFLLGGVFKSDVMHMFSSTNIVKQESSDGSVD